MSTKTNDKRRVTTTATLDPLVTGTSRIFDPAGKLKIPDPVIERKAQAPAPTGPQKSGAPVAPVHPQVERQDLLKRRILDHPSVKQALAAALAAQEKFRARIVELLPLLEPENEARILHKVIEQEHDVSVIEAARKKIHELRGEAAKSARARALNLKQNAYLQYAAVVRSLLTESERVNAETLKEAVTAETEFFLKFGLPREATGVVHAIERIAGILASFRKALDHTTVNVATFAGARLAILNWFK